MIKSPTILIRRVPMDWMVVSVSLQEGIEANLGHRSSFEVPTRFRHEFATSSVDLWAQVALCVLLVLSWRSW